MWTSKATAEFYKKAFGFQQVGETSPTSPLAQGYFLSDGTLNIAVLKFKTETEAVQMANAIDLGLTAAVWTNDINRALRVAQQVQAGYVWINGVGQHYRGVPYGGFKNSGIGREEGISELLSYTEEKVINIVMGGADYNPAAG